MIRLGEKSEEGNRDIWSWSNMKEWGRTQKSEEVRIIQRAIKLLVGPQTGILSNPPKFQQSEVRTADEDEDS